MNNSRNPEERIGLCEAPTGASAQCESKKLQKNNSPLYAKVKKDKPQSHYAEIQTCSTARPRAIEKMEPNYTQVIIFDDHPCDESPLKPY